MDPDPLLIFLETLIIPSTTFVVFCVLFILSLVFVSILHFAEVAFFNLSAKEINKIKKKNKKNYRRVLRLIEKPYRLLSVIKLGQIIYSVLFILISLHLSTQLYEYISNQHLLGQHSYSYLNALLAILITILLLAIIGIYIPRVYAANNRLSAALFAGHFIGVFDYLFGRIGTWLHNNSSFLAKYSNTFQTKEMSTEELHEAIEQGRNYTATIEEVNIFKSILKFDEIQVKQIMKPRTDVTALSAASSFSDVKRVIQELGFSRMPVYEGSLDKIIGVIHTKDLLPHIHHQTFNWQSEMRKTVFVPDTKYAESLLKEFQQSRQHMAIVVDEFGGTAGLVTLEDIMEEIIGDIQDEFDEEELMARKINEHNYIFEGKTPINDACRFASLGVDTFDAVKGNSDSIAGLVLELLGKFPKVNQKVIYNNYQFTVLGLDKKRIDKVKLFILPAENDAD